MSRLRRNRKSGLGKQVVHGMLGKQKRYRNTEFERVPELTEEERQRLLVDKLKPYSYDPKKHKVVRAVGAVSGEEPSPSPSPTPTVTPTPSSTPPETYYILDEDGNIITDENGNPLVRETAPDPTPSPTPTQSVTPTITPTQSVTPSVTPTISVTPTVTPTPSSTPPFDPSGITGLSAWYDFSDSGNTQLSGSEILTAYDQSGNGLDIISVSGKRPILTADTISNIAGQTSAVFTRSGAEYLYNTSMNITLSSGYTWFYVMDFNPAGVTGERSLMYLYGTTNNQTKATNYYNYSLEDSIRTQYPGAEFDGYSTLTPQFPKALMWSKIGLPNSPYGQFDAELNDTTYTGAISDSFNMVDIDLLYLPGPFTGSVGNDIRIGELLIYNRQLNTSEISQVESWLKNKWNYTNW